MVFIKMLDNITFRHLPLDALRTFAVAAQLRSFTRAGKEVHRTQSAVSMQIKRLETEIDRALFVRKGRTIALTADGEVLLGYAQQMLRLHDEALADLTSPAIKGVVRLGVPDDYATAYLPRVLARFAHAYPKVRVDVQCDTSKDLLAGLKQDKLDLCLATGDGTPVDAQPGYEIKTLSRIPLVWMGAGDLDLSAIWDRKAPLPVAVFHDGCLHRRWALLALKQANIPYRIAFSSPSLAPILAAVRSGLAISPVTISSLEHDCRALPSESGLPSLPTVTVSLHARSSDDHQAAKCLARFMEERFQTGQPSTAN